MNDNPNMMPMTLAEIAQAVSGELAVPKGVSVPEALVATSAVSDSRQVTAGSVFVAIAGEHADGHAFVAQVGERGAVAAIVDHVVDDAELAQVVVDDTVRALGALARHNIERRRGESAPFSIIGITGSVGKTTTKDLLNALLGSIGPTVAPLGSFNNEIGLPLTALNVDAHTRFLIAEMGANHVGEIAKLVTIAPPDVAVVLKVGVAHLGEFGSVERIAQAKSEIVQGLVPGGVAILNADDLRVAAMADLASGKVLWFGLYDGEASYSMTTAREITVDGYDRPSFTLIDARGRTARTQLGISGIHNVINALAAASVAEYFGMEPDAIAGILRAVRRISPHRMAISTIADGPMSFTLIDDSFNANPDSMKAGLMGLSKWEPESGRKPHRVAVLGAMLELGHDEHVLHAAVGAYAARLGVDTLIAVGGRGDRHFDVLAQDLARGAEEQLKADHTTAVSVDLVHDTHEADRLVRHLAQEHPNTVVLLKGSHFAGLSVLAEQWGAYDDRQRENADSGHGNE